MDTKPLVVWLLDADPNWQGTVKLELEDLYPGLCRVIPFEGPVAAHASSAAPPALIAWDVGTVGLLGAEGIQRSTVLLFLDKYPGAWVLIYTGMGPEYAQQIVDEVRDDNPEGGKLVLATTMEDLCDEILKCLGGAK